MRDYSFDWFIINLNKKKCCSDIIDFIIANIKSRQLKSGDIVLPYRLLAEVNEVSPSSAKKAYARLIVQGWLKSVRGSGTFVSDTLPGHKVQIRKSGFKNKFPGTLNSLKNILVEPDSYIKQPFVALGTDFPNPALFPEDVFGKYHNKHATAMANISQAGILRYYDGDALKQAVLTQLNDKRGFGVNAGMLDIIQERDTCLNRLFKILLKKDDVVINTSVYDVLLSKVLKNRKADIHHISRLDDHFIEKIEELIKVKPVKAIYIRSSCSFPEAHCLSPEISGRLVALAVAHQICIIEEDDEHEFWYEHEPPRPLACYDHGGFVVYLACLSKARPYTRSLRTIVASVELINLLHKLPAQSTENRDVVLEHAFADFMEDGHLADYQKAVRLRAKNDADALDWVLGNYLSDHLHYFIPRNGLTFWLKFDDDQDLNVLLSELEKLNIPVPYHPMNQRTKEKVCYMLLGFGAFDINEAESAAKLLKEVLNAFKNPTDASGDPAHAG